MDVLEFVGPYFIAHFRMREHIGAAGATANVIVLQGN